MTFTKQTLIALAVLAGCAAAVPACSNNETPSGSGSALQGNTGRINLNLAVGSDTLSSVDMKIYTGATATGTPLITRSINVTSADATVSAFVGALAGGDYTVTFDATASPSNKTCHGQDVFTIITGTTGNKTVTITCGTVNPPPARGNEVINGTVVSVSDCPYLKNTVITPLTSGGPISVSTETSDAASTVEWKDGTTTIVTGLSGTLDCATATAGAHNLTVTVTKAGTACTESLSQTVTCVGGTAGTGGAPGTGGAAPGTGGAAPGTGGAAPGTGGAAPGTGGAAPGTGGAAPGTGGQGTGGGVVSFCRSANLPQVADTDGCLACESDQCDPPVTPGCTKFAEGTSQRTQCDAVLGCIRSTNCINQGNVNCYCGAAGITTCKADAANASGACKAEITAAYPAGSDAAFIVNNIGVITIPGGTALALGQCDFSRCGETAAGECVPYCTN